MLLLSLSRSREEIIDEGLSDASSLFVWMTWWMSGMSSTSVGNDSLCSSQVRTDLLVLSSQGIDLPALRDAAFPEYEQLLCLRSTLVDSVI